jgi:hypothetical protein
MFDRKPKLQGTTLYDRIEKAGARRVAILGLHPHAGARMVLQSLVDEISKKGQPLGVTSAPRLPLEEEEGADRQPVTRVQLPEGAWIASSAPQAEAGGAVLSQVEPTEFTSVLGQVTIQRVTAAGEVHLHGPGEAPSMEAVLARLGELSRGMVLVDGGWERRAFASPGVTDGVVLVLAAGYSATARALRGRGAIPRRDAVGAPMRRERAPRLGRDRLEGRDGPPRRARTDDGADAAGASRSDPRAPHARRGCRSRRSCSRTA